MNNNLIKEIYEKEKNKLLISFDEFTILVKKLSETFKNDTNDVNDDLEISTYSSTNNSKLPFFKISKDKKINLNEYTNTEISDMKENSTIDLDSTDDYSNESSSISLNSNITETTNTSDTLVFDDNIIKILNYIGINDNVNDDDDDENKIQNTAQNTAQNKNSNNCEITSSTLNTTNSLSFPSEFTIDDKLNLNDHTQFTDLSKFDTQDSSLQSIKLNKIPALNNSVSLDENNYLNTDEKKNILSTGKINIKINPKVQYKLNIDLSDNISIMIG